MLDELKKHFSSIQILIILSIIAVGLYVFQTIWQVLGIFSDIFVMLISAWLISFILEPAVNQLTKVTKMYKIASALVVYMIFLGFIAALLFFFLPTVTTQLQSLIQLLPKYFASYPAFINKWGDLVSTSLSNSLTIIPSVANFFFNAFLTLIISFYFIIDKEHINQEFFNLLPKKWHRDAQFTQEVIDSTFASFLRVQLVFGIICGLATFLVLSIFGVEFAASTAFIAGLLTMVPLLGPVLGIVPPALVAFITDPNKALFVFIILLAMQQVVFNIIGPRLLGRAFKLHPVIVLLSFVVGLKIAGGIGAILAVPVLGILIVVIHRLSRHFLHHTEK